MESDFEKWRRIHKEYFGKSYHKTIDAFLIRLQKAGFFLPQTFEEKATELAEFGIFSEKKYETTYEQDARDFLKQKYGEKNE